VERVERDGGEIVVHLSRGEPLRASHLLVATGRRPNTDDLGCAAAGVALDRHGSVIVDDRYRPSAPGIYAVGDVVPQPHVTELAWDDHRILYDLLLGRSQRGRGGRSIPYSVFTDPQVAGVGLTEREARDRHIEYEAATMPFGNVARAIETDERAG